MIAAVALRRDAYNVSRRVMQPARFESQTSQRFSAIEDLSSRLRVHLFLGMRLSHCIVSRVESGQAAFRAAVVERPRFRLLLRFCCITLRRKKLVAMRWRWRRSKSVLPVLSSSSLHLLLLTRVPPMDRV